MNFEQARFNMVEQQIRPWEVLDGRVLELLETIQREDFVPVRYRKLAFADIVRAHWPEIRAEAEAGALDPAARARQARLCAFANRSAIAPRPVAFSRSR